MKIPGRFYEIQLRLPKQGGGWCLRLLQDGVEVGSAVFHPSKGFGSPAEALLDAYEQAHAQGGIWMRSKVNSRSQSA